MVCKSFYALLLCDKYMSARYFAKYCASIDLQNKVYFYSSGKLSDVTVQGPVNIIMKIMLNEIALKNSFLIED